MTQYVSYLFSWLFFLTRIDFTSLKMFPIFFFIRFDLTCLMFHVSFYFLSLGLTLNMFHDSCFILFSFTRIDFYYGLYSFGFFPLELTLTCVILLFYLIRIDFGSDCHWRHLCPDVRRGPGRQGEHPALHQRGRSQRISGRRRLKEHFRWNLPFVS